MINILLILSLLDALLTYLGIQHNFISEANPVMNWFMSKNIFMFFLIKVSLPLVLYIFLKRKMSSLVIKCMSIATVIYFAVLIMHLFWISKVI